MAERPLSGLTALLAVMTALGLWPRDWRTRLLSPLYSAYSMLLEASMVAYAASKLAYAVNVRPCDKFMFEVFMSAFLVGVVLQRFALSQAAAGLVRLVSDLDRLRGLVESYASNVLSRYDRYQQWMVAGFGSATAFGVAQIFLDFRSAVSRCDAVDAGKRDPARRLLVELWLPFDETRPGRYAAVDAAVSALVLLAASSIFVLGVVVPIFALEVCCHFRIAALLFARRLRTNDWDVRDKVELREAVKYHQLVMELAARLERSFHVVVGLKLVFLTLPIIVGILTLTKKRAAENLVGAMIHFIVQLLIELFVLCWFGEMLTYHSQLVHGAVYASAWPRMRVRLRRGLLLVSAVAYARPARLLVAPRFRPADLETFIAVCQFSYSLYTILTILT